MQLSVYAIFSPVTAWGETKFKSLLSFSGSILNKIFEVASSIFSFFGSKVAGFLNADPRVPSASPMPEGDDYGVPSAPPMPEGDDYGVPSAPPMPEGDDYEVPAAPPMPAGYIDVFQACELVNKLVSFENERKLLIKVIDFLHGSFDKDELIGIAIAIVLKCPPDPAHNQNFSTLACELATCLTAPANESQHDKLRFLSAFIKRFVSVQLRGDTSKLPSISYSPSAQPNELQAYKAVEGLVEQYIENKVTKELLIQNINNFSQLVNKYELIGIAIATVIKCPPDPAHNQNFSTLACELATCLTAPANESQRDKLTFLSTFIEHFVFVQLGGDINNLLIQISVEHRNFLDQLEDPNFSRTPTFSSLKAAFTGAVRSAVNFKYNCAGLEGLLHKYSRLECHDWKRIVEILKRANLAPDRISIFEKKIEELKPVAALRALGIETKELGVISEENINIILNAHIWSKSISGCESLITDVIQELKDGKQDLYDNMSQRILLGRYSEFKVNHKKFKNVFAMIVANFPKFSLNKCSSRKFIQCLVREGKLTEGIAEPLIRKLEISLKDVQELDGEALYYWTFLNRNPTQIELILSRLEQKETIPFGVFDIALKLEERLLQVPQPDQCNKFIKALIKKGGFLRLYESLTHDHLKKSFANMFLPGMGLKDKVDVFDKTDDCTLLCELFRRKTLGENLKVSIEEQKLILTDKKISLLAVLNPSLNYTEVKELLNKSSFDIYELQKIRELFTVFIVDEYTLIRQSLKQNRIPELKELLTEGILPNEILRQSRFKPSELQELKELLTDSILPDRYTLILLLEKKPFIRSIPLKFAEFITKFIVDIISSDYNLINKSLEGFKGVEEVQAYVNDLSKNSFIFGINIINEKIKSLLNPQR